MNTLMFKTGKNTILKPIFFLINIIFSQNYTLDDCIQIATKQKKTVLAAEIEVRSASKGLKSSYSEFLPLIQASSSAGISYFKERETINIDWEDQVQDFQMPSLDTSKANYYKNQSAGITLNQKLYAGGRSWNQIKQAKTNLQIAKLNERLTLTQVIQSVIQSYYNLLKAQKLLDVSNTNLDVSLQQVSLIKNQFDLGSVKKTDLLKAQVAQGQARVDMLNNKTRLQNARRVLFNDMGLQDFGQEINVSDSDWNIPTIPSSAAIIKLLRENNPSILAAEARIELSNILHKLQSGLRLPSLNSSMNFSANDQTGSDFLGAIRDDWNFGLNLTISIPVYTGNTIRIQQQQAKLSIMQSEYSYATLLNDLRVEAELIRESLSNYAEIIPLNQSVVTSAEEDLRLARERYALGSATILEVLDAQASLVRSNSTLINTVHDARIQEASLKALLGNLDLEYLQEEK